MAFPSVDELAIALSVGQGVAVIVEGDSNEDDPFFYRRWFNHRQGEVSFYPQNGWAQVITAVTALREQDLRVPVYGIIDRDFCAAHDLDKDFESLGILRTPRYTLENYLLDPECWAATFQLIFRNPAALQGWEQPEFVTRQINDAYQACCGIAAHNWVVHTITPHYESLPSFQSRNFLKHFKAYTDDHSIGTALQSWQSQLNASEDLREMFHTRLTFLRGQDAAFHEMQVSGWHVLRYLHDKFPHGKTTFSLDHYLTLYLEKCSSAPPDLTVLIEQILAHAWS